MRTKLRISIAVGAAILISSAAVQGQTVRSGAGPLPADILTARDAFRADLGALNPNVVGSFGSGRREINWDGVPAGFSAPNNLPANFFNSNSPRGVVFSTPGTGFQVSANSGLVTPDEFGNIDPSYPTLFSPFSAQKLFTALGSTVTDVRFFVPGTTTVALTSGFGVVFSDVDLADTSSLQFFDDSNVSLGTFSVPSATGNETFSFLGVDFDQNIVSRVRIISGNQVLAAGNVTEDLVAMDDFIFGEPAAVPAPATLLLFASGLAAFGILRRKRR